MNKPKRRITAANFNHEGAHVALVSKTLNGGPANQWDVLLTKSVNDISEDVFQKASEVRVELSFVEFLRKFFNMYYTESEMLAKLLGYSVEEEMEEPESYSEYINKKIENITLLKDASSCDDLEAFMKELDAKSVLSLLEAQSLFEKATSVSNHEKTFPDKELPEVLDKSVEEDNQIGENSEMNLEELMKSAEVKELMAVELEKARDEGKAERQAEVDALVADLEKSKEEVEVLKAEKAEAKAAERKARLVKAVGEEQAEEIFKSTEVLADEAFEVVVKGYEAQAQAAEESDLTKELGVGGEGNADEEDATARLLKAKYTK